MNNKDVYTKYVQGISRVGVSTTNSKKLQKLVGITRTKSFMHKKMTDNFHRPGSRCVLYDICE